MICSSWTKVKPYFGGGQKEENCAIASTNAIGMSPGLVGHKMKGNGSLILNSKRGSDV